MKHVIVMALGAALALASCVSKGTVVKVEEQRDSLSVVVSAKDSLISAVFEDISSISENLALIRTRENLLSVAGDAEGGRRPVEEINNDIAPSTGCCGKTKSRSLRCKALSRNCGKPICVSTDWKR